MGGQDGSDMALMLHRKNLPMTKYIGAGIYIGGIGAAKKLVESFQAAPKDFKFVFNTVEWGPGVLEKEIESGRWDVCQVPVDLLLSQDSKVYSNLWSLARSVLATQ